MIPIIVILAVAYLLVPLLDITLNEQVRYVAKILVYVVTLVWLVYTLWIGHRLV